MAEEKKAEMMDGEKRFRYIGFEVFPEKAEKFWKDEQEEKKYVEHAKQKEKGLSALEREHSSITASVFSKTDRLVIMISSILMIIGFFLPWFTLTIGEKAIGYGLFGYIGQLGLIFSYSGFSGMSLAMFAILVLLFMLASLLYAIKSLLIVLKVDKDEEKYQAKVKKTLKLGFVPIALWLVLVIISAIGINTPLLSHSGIKSLGESFNLVTFISISGIGMWTVMCGLIVNSFKSNDL